MNTSIIIADVVVRQDTKGRYSLNDLHRAAGGENRHRPKYWMENSQTQALIDEILTEGGIPPSTVKGGINQGTYVSKELVYAYAMWISPAFHLSVIRTFDEVVAGRSPQGNISDKMQAGVTLLGFMRRELNLSHSSILGACQKLQTAFGLPNLAPAYAIDAPSDTVDGSSRSTRSLTDLLRQNGVAMTAAIAYVRLEAAGIVERKTRPSTGNKTKSFWSITSKGLLYGKNITSPVNPRETQPHFFESRAVALLAIVTGRGE